MFDYEYLMFLERNQGRKRSTDHLNAINSNNLFKFELVKKVLEILRRAQSIKKKFNWD